MPAGRPKLPTPIRLLQGSKTTQWRIAKEQEQGAETEAAKGIPRCPSHIKDEARREWRRVTKEIHSMGILTFVDRGALEVYCRAYAVFREAANEIDRLAKEVEEKTGKKRSGMIVPSPKNFPMVNPNWHIMLRAEEQMRAFRMEFGLTALSRSKIRVQKILDKDPFTTFRDRRAQKESVQNS